MTQANTGADAMSGRGDQRRALAESNRSRIAAMFQGRPDHEKFTAMMLTRAVDPEETADILNTLRGAGTDLEKRLPEVGNRPLRHFVNKSRAQLRREFGDDEEKVNLVTDALRGAGMEVSDERQRETTAADETETRAARPTRAAQPTLTATGGVIGAGAVAQRAFGTEQVPADEIWHLSDDELMGVDGLSAADVVEIRRLQAANTARANLPPGVAATPGVPIANAGDALAPAIPGEGGDPMRTGLSEPGPDAGNAGEGAAPPAPATETGGKRSGKGKAGKGAGDAGAAGGNPPANPPMGA